MKTTIINPDLNSGTIFTIDKKEYKIILSKQEIDLKLNQIAKAIYEAHKNEEIVLLGVAMGGIFTIVSLTQKLQALGLSVEIDLIRVTRYISDGKTGKLQIVSEPKTSLIGKVVIVVEDLIDKGVTMNFIHRYLKNKKAKALKYFVLIIKEKHKSLLFKIDYFMLKGAFGWLVGFGMDSYGYLRGLPFVCEKIKIKRKAK